MKRSPARKSLPLLNRYHLQSESAHPPGGTSTAEGQMAKFKPKKPHRFYNGVAEQDGHLMWYMLLVPGQYQISKRSFFGRIVYFFATSAAGTRKPVILPWYGSMNLLSRDDVEDNIMRLESREVAQELLGIVSDSKISKE